MVLVLVFVLISLIVLAEQVERREIPPQPACLGCEYDLGGHGPAGICPECGAAYGPTRIQSIALRFNGDCGLRWGATVVLGAASLAVAWASLDYVEMCSYAAQGRPWVDCIAASRSRDHLGLAVFWPLGVFLALSPLLVPLRWRRFAAVHGIATAAAFGLTFLNGVLGQL